MDTRTTQIQALADRRVQRLREAITTPEDERVPLLREAAALLVEIRGLHTNKAGGVDWQGRSWEYRTLVMDIYEQAGLEAAGEEGLKVALRYHVGNALRDTLTEDELEGAGLTLRAPRSRMAWRYQEGANRAEFARQLVYRITRTPAERPDPATLEHAKNLHVDLEKWLRRHGVTGI